MSERWVTLVHVKVGRLTDCNLERTAQSIAEMIPSHYIDVLTQLCASPVWDGDLISKEATSKLIECDLAVKIVYNNEFGYTSATPIALHVLRAM